MSPWGSSDYKLIKFIIIQKPNPINTNIKIMTSDWPALMPHEEDFGSTCMLEKAALVQLWSSGYGRKIYSWFCLKLDIPKGEYFFPPRKCPPTSCTSYI